MMLSLELLAQAVTSAPTSSGSTPPAPSGSSGSSSPWGGMLPLVAAIGIFYFIWFRGRNKERDKFAEMLKNLKRNDRVQTIGGILGTVVEVRDNEVVLKVDEASNTKIRVTRAAIKEVMAPAAEEQK